MAKLSYRCFCYFTAAMFMSLRRTQTWRLHTKLYNDTLLQITREWKTAETWFLPKLFIYQSCIVSQTLDFFHRMATIFILITWLVKTEIWNKNLLTEEFGTDDITKQGRSASLKAYQLSSEFENCFCSKCSSHFGRENGAGGRGRNWTHHLRQKSCHVIKATRGHERSVTL